MTPAQCTEGQIYRLPSNVPSKFEISSRVKPERNQSANVNLRTESCFEDRNACSPGEEQEISRADSNSAVSDESCPVWKGCAKPGLCKRSLFRSFTRNCYQCNATTEMPQMRSRREDTAKPAIRTGVVLVLAPCFRPINGQEKGLESSVASWLFPDFAPFLPVNPPYTLKDFGDIRKSCKKPAEAWPHYLSTLCRYVGFILVLAPWFRPINGQEKGLESSVASWVSPDFAPFLPVAVAWRFGL
ncbi:hypothetical protein WH47_12316 [Habropoda laboriosa]|uniref:Uncharacterized protein n=1 Tax=Habropoda laboriosa TaxID=597456 RepID=A0A0L7RB71_9HYME|nr:hypothetical protein WH47_12316 [Habropoda laboriosa]